MKASTTQHGMPLTEGDTLAYTVVGTGSADCIAAARLAETSSVLLLEGGERAHHETLTADGFKHADRAQNSMPTAQTAQSNQRAGVPS